MGWPDLGITASAMPELAEIALYARDIALAVKNRPLTGVTFPNQRDWGNVIVPTAVRRQLLAMKGHEISASSGGKGIYLRRKVAGSTKVEFRLGMTGQFGISRPLDKWARHCFLELHFAELKIFYSDPRRFGRVRLGSPSEHVVGGYSSDEGFWIKIPDPPKGFMTRSRIDWLIGTGDKTGIGNYMANEALGRLHLSPYLPCRSIKEAKIILRKCAEIARASFRSGGNSFGTGYANLHGEQGRYLRHCKFYGKQNIPRREHRGRPVYSYFKPLES